MTEVMKWVHTAGTKLPHRPVSTPVCGPWLVHSTAGVVSDGGREEPSVPDLTSKVREMVAESGSLPPSRIWAHIKAGFVGDSGGESAGEGGQLAGPAVRARWVVDS